MKLLIHSLKGARAVDSEDIIYCEADGNNSNIYLYSLITNEQRKYFVSTKNLKELDNLLPPIDFYRCHKCYLINFKYFQEFEVSTSSIIMSNETKIKIAKGKKIESKKHILEYFNKFS